MYRRLNGMKKIEEEIREMVDKVQKERFPMVETLPEAAKARPRNDIVMEKIQTDEGLHELGKDLMNFNNIAQVYNELEFVTQNIDRLTKIIVEASQGRERLLQYQNVIKQVLHDRHQRVVADAARPATNSLITLKDRVD